MKLYIVILFLPLIFIGCGPSIWYESGDETMKALAYTGECRGVIDTIVNPRISSDVVLCVNTESRGYKAHKHVYFLKTGNIDRIKSGEEESEFLSLIYINGNISKTTCTIYDNGYSHLYLTILPDSTENIKPFTKGCDTIEVYLGGGIYCSGNFIQDTLVVDSVYPLN